MNVKYLAIVVIAIVILISIFLLQAKKAEKAIATVSIDVLPENAGQTSPPEGNYFVEMGSILEITQIPSDKAEFLHWQVDGNILKGEKLQLRIDSDKKIIATYIPLEVEIDRRYPAHNAKFIESLYNTT